MLGSELGCGTGKVKIALLPGFCMLKRSEELMGRGKVKAKLDLAIAGTELGLSE